MKTEFPLEAPLDFLQHLWELNHALEQRSLQMERTMGITAQQRLFLRCIGQHPGLTASQLAGVLHLDRGTVSVSLQRLIKKGLVSARRDARDSRRMALSLTARGAKLSGPDARTVEHVVERLLGEANGREVANTKQVLRRLSEGLRAG